ncbi:citrate/2-methylcitrate synthase [Tessaracoccus sp.]|uniref:citrate/2-methylcitrate synthase n=1 Tax=Tessaracoccus sp. TaxID=1971211 RepID=UPI00260FBEF2|nr:citrate/2-methylcitrate synthase [Tessaracoccus sp.]
MGFPAQHFTALFALGRLPGWIAQWREQHADPGRKIPTARAGSASAPIAATSFPIDQRWRSHPRKAGRTPRRALFRSPTGCYRKLDGQKPRPSPASWQAPGVDRLGPILRWRVR